MARINLQNTQTLTNDVSSFTDMFSARSNTKKTKTDAHNNVYKNAKHFTKQYCNTIALFLPI